MNGNQKIVSTPMNKDKTKFCIHSRLKSFQYAFEGIKFTLRSQHNARLHIAAALIVIIAGVYFKITAEEWRWLIMCITLVWFAEIINTAFEYLCDTVSPDFNMAVKRAKDIAAGAVLICAIGAAIIGLGIFLPYFT